MTLKYKVKTKHTKETLKDFVKFSMRAGHPRATMQLCIIGGGLIVISAVAERNSALAWVCLLLGILICGCGLFRHHIGIAQLARQDQAYINGWEIEMEFWDGEFRIQNGSEAEKVVKRYNEIRAVYGDEKNYYIASEDDEMYVVPRKDFVNGMQEKFEKFTEEKTKKNVHPVPAKFTNKLKLTYARMKEMDAAHDAMIEANKKSKKNKKEKR